MLQCGHGCPNGEAEQPRPDQRVTPRLASKMALAGGKKMVEDSSTPELRRRGC